MDLKILEEEFIFYLIRKFKNDNSISEIELSLLKILLINKQNNFEFDINTIGEQIIKTLNKEEKIISSLD